MNVFFSLLFTKCIIKQLLNSVFAWYHELSKPRVFIICHTVLGFDNSWYHAQPHPIIVCYNYNNGPYFHQIKILSIYTLRHLGDLSNLIGSLSRTIQQYSPPGEWMICELCVFPIFLVNDLLKVCKILALTSFRQEKTLKRFKTAFFHLL